MLVRAIRPADAPGLVEAFEQLSETSRYRRFFTVKPHLSERSVAFFTDVDHHDHEALVAVAPGSGQLVGVARFIRNPEEPDQAEVAVTVIDSWQQRGLGTALLRELAQRAAEEGIRHFTAEILAENRPMLTLARRLGPAETASHGTTVSARIDLPPGGAGGHFPLRRLRSAARRGARGVHRPAARAAGIPGPLGEGHRDPAGAGQRLPRPGKGRETPATAPSDKAGKPQPPRQRRVTDS